MGFTVAEKVLIVGGSLNLAYGVLLGYPITVLRLRGAPTTSRYLLTAHVGALLHGAIMLGLIWAVRLSSLGSGLAQCSGLAGGCFVCAGGGERHAQLAFQHTRRVQGEG